MCSALRARGHITLRLQSVAPDAHTDTGTWRAGSLNITAYLKVECCSVCLLHNCVQVWAVKWCLSVLSQEAPWPLILPWDCRRRLASDGARGRKGLKRTGLTLHGLQACVEGVLKQWGCWVCGCEPVRRMSSLTKKPIPNCSNGSANPGGSYMVNIVGGVPQRTATGKDSKENSPSQVKKFLVIGNRLQALWPMATVGVCGCFVTFCEKREVYPVLPAFWVRWWWWWWWWQRW